MLKILTITKLPFLAYCYQLTNKAEVLRLTMGFENVKVIIIQVTINSVCVKPSPSATDELWEMGKGKSF